MANLAFRELEKELSNIKFPDNLVNKHMSLILSSLNSFELILTRYYNIRELLRKIHLEEFAWIKAHPDAKVRKAHPDEAYASAAIRVDVESLFIFGIIIIRRTLPLIKLFLPDRTGEKVFDDFSNFYRWLFESKKLSSLATDFRNELGENLKWLNAVLRFYRNKFIEHFSQPQQQGMNFSIGGKDFALHSYKWGFNSSDEKRIIDFKAKMVARSIILTEELNPRHYVQLLFDNIVSIPDDLISEALNLIEDIGIDSPQPELLIERIEKYLTLLFSFMCRNIDRSEFVKYQKDEVDKKLI